VCFAGSTALTARSYAKSRNVGSKCHSSSRDPVQAIAPFPTTLLCRSPRRNQHEYGTLRRRSSVQPPSPWRYHRDHTHRPCDLSGRIESGNCAGRIRGPTGEDREWRRSHVQNFQCVQWSRSRGTEYHHRSFATHRACDPLTHTTYRTARQAGTHEAGQRAEVHRARRA